MKPKGKLKRLLLGALALLVVYLLVAPLLTGLRNNMRSARADSGERPSGFEELVYKAGRPGEKLAVAFAPYYAYWRFACNVVAKEDEPDLATKRKEEKELEDFLNALKSISDEYHGP